MISSRAPIVIDFRFVRRVVPILLLFAATSTGTLLASDPCKVFVVPDVHWSSALSGAAHHNQRTDTPGRHCSRGRDGVKPISLNTAIPSSHRTRKVAMLHPMSPKEQDASLKFACEKPSVPTEDTPFTGLLAPEEIPPFLPDVPTLTAELTPPPELFPPPATPTPSGGDTGTESPAYPNIPIFFPPFGGPGPGIPLGSPPKSRHLVSAPPIVPTPEPGSFVFLATGVAAMWAVRRNGRRSDS